MGQKVNSVSDRWRSIGLAAVVAVGTAMLSVQPVQAAGAWKLTQDLDPAGGMNCSMETYWDDGSEFSIFSNSNDYIGFYVSDPSWHLSDGQASNVRFRFGGRDFRFPVKAISGTEVIGDLASYDHQAMRFLERWARAYSMDIVFPNGDSWTVNLNGTMATFQDWTRCHDRLQHIARGGHRPPPPPGPGGNPWGGRPMGPPPGGGNPF